VTSEDVRVGRVWFNPWSTDIVVYPVRVVRVVWTKAPSEGNPIDESFSFNTKEGVSLNADVAMSFHLEESAAPAVYTKFRQTVDTMKDGYIRDVVRDALARASSTRTVDDLIGEGRASFQSDAAKIVEDKLKTEGFVVDAFSLINDTRVPASIKQRIDEKIAATQQAIAAENKLRQTKAEVQQQIEEARGTAEAAKLAAQGEADAAAILTRALTPELMRYRLSERWIEKWDGKTPTVQGGAQPLINLPQAAP
jgi:regulator of protease activity HflC (stomatin/prohibitin superfamily)